MKRIIALMLGVFALIIMWCVPVFAEYWNEGNDGNSWETAYIIDSVEGFVMMTGTRATSEDIGKYFKLSADLEFTSENYAENTEHNFGGHFDGQNHTIRVNIVSESYGLVSLFGDVATEGIAIRNLNVEGTVRGSTGTETGSTLVGGIAGELTEGIIENCSFIGSVEAVSGGACAAGIASLTGPTTTLY